MKSKISASDPAALGREIAALPDATAADLKRRWRALYGTEPPPRISRELLTRAIAYRLQERTYGGLKPWARRLLERIGGDGSPSRTRLAPPRKTGAGTVLIREWHGASHRATVLDDGVIYCGRRYQSLSEVARLITGTRWSGPRFFGLKGRAEEAGNG